MESKVFYWSVGDNPRGRYLRISESGAGYVACVYKMELDTYRHCGTPGLTTVLGALSGLLRVFQSLKGCAAGRGEGAPSLCLLGVPTARHGWRSAVSWRG